MAGGLQRKKGERRRPRIRFVVLIYNYYVVIKGRTNPDLFIIRALGLACINVLCKSLNGID